MEELNVLESKILEYVKAKKKNLTYKQIKRALKIRKEDEIKELDCALNTLLTKGFLYLNDYDEYQLFEKDNSLAIGELRCNSKNKAYVVVGKNIVFIPDSNLNGAITGDVVIVKRNNFKTATKTKGVIDKVLVRKKGEIIFDYIDGEFVPYNWPFPINIIIDEKEKENLVEGTRVLINITLDEVDGAFISNIKSIIGHKDDPQIDVKTIASANGIVIDFSKQALEQSETISTSVSADEIANRLKLPYSMDLRDKNIFTIDGENTKDIDDAISIWKNEKGNYVLGVHIADVSYYVKENTSLDLDAKERSTSYYPYNYVIPMLPHRLSNGICSLNPNVDRLAFSCIMEINPKGEIIDFQFLDTIINSKKKMTYEAINDIFERGIPHKDYDPYLYDLALMQELSEILSKRKRERGYISFGSHDVDFKDENGLPIEIRKSERGMSQQLIENFMLTANECVATFTYWIDMPGIYRVHPIPNVENVKTLVDSLELKIKIPNNITNPKVLQGVLDKIAEFDEGEVYSDFLLQSMKRAYYSPNNIGHFGLALDNYTHFTSPIRRYMDLRTHRIIRTVRDDILSINYNELHDDLVKNCQYASQREKIADQTEREVNNYKMAEFMEQHIGELFVGYVSYVSRSGLTIKTDNMISGKIPVETLNDQGYKLNEKRLSYCNGETELFIGDRVEIIVLHADKNTGKIEFAFNKQIEKTKVKNVI